MNASSPFVQTPGEVTQAELDRLSDFLLSREAGLARPMGISTIDGLFCAVLSGPQLILPLQAMRWVWDSVEGEQEPVFSSLTEAQEIMGLLTQHWNRIARDLQAGDYEPLVFQRDLSGDRTVPILDDWCIGYYCGMNIDMPSWAALLIDKPAWFSSVLRYGTKEGYELDGKHPLTHAEQWAASAQIQEMALAIHAYFLAQRQVRPASSPPPAPIRRNSPKMGRNEVCFCGSGRKFKHCHGLH